MTRTEHIRQSESIWDGLLTTEPPVRKCDQPRLI